ncbi:putative propionyl-CoA carboxylase, biotin carboxyl carrier protein [Verrucomicrobia bacterium]|nr:putative propionyl-CoA carboxylase, biotin carboxyl carrier protein [Verrucomicrobiota bacterium]
MIKKLRVTVDGNTYDVSVELPDEVAAPMSSAPPPPPPAVASPATIPSPPPVSTPAAAAPAASAAGPGEVPSPLAGRVTAVVVSAGQEVKEGDHLLTLEAMKMNTFVFAPRGGKVAEIKVVVGDAVQEGQVLARIQ